MSPLSLRLDDETRLTLEQEASTRRVGLSTLLRDLATEAAQRIRRERIRRQSAAVGDYVAEAPEAAAFYADWGTPQARLDG